MVRIDQVGRTAASALLLDESGEVITPAPRAPAPAKRRPRKRPLAPKPDAEKLAPAPGSTTPEPVAATDGAAPKDPAGSIEAADGSEDGLQSKPRRRGRRGGRRRSAAKAKAGAAETGTES
jgi:ribonuclease G